MPIMTFVIGLILSAPLSVGVARAAENAQMDKTAQEDPNKKICQRDARSNGSIMAKRVCHTRAEWAALEQGSSDSLERMRTATSRSAVAGSH